MKPIVFFFVLTMTMLSWSDPVDCSYLEEGRTTRTLGCRCAVKEKEINEKKYRINVETCLGGKNLLYVIDLREGNKWKKAKGTQCSRLDGIAKYSCKTYDFLEDDWFNKSKLTTLSTAQIRQAWNENLDSGDAEYLQIR